MVPRSKRLILSAASTGIAMAICDIAICAQYTISGFVHDHARAELGSPVWIARFVGGLFAVFPWVLLFCLPGWILALPITLIANRIAGPRFWVWWVAGTCIGPLVMYAVSLYYVRSYSEGRSTIVWNSWFSLATGVAAVATMLYLWLLRREEQRLPS